MEKPRMKPTQYERALPFAESFSIAVTRWDRSEELKPGHNHYALALYLARLDDRKPGQSVAQFLYDNFNGRLLSHLERWFGVPVTYGGGAHDKGRPA